MSHLDLDALADLLAGEGSDADVAHVADCAGCAGRLDELAAADASVAARLAQVPAPPVPPDLADRLAAALAAEPPLEPSTPDWAPGAPSTGSRTVTPFPSAGAPRRRAPRAPMAAAAALLVAVGTVGGLALVTDGTSSEDSSTAAGGAGGDTAAPALDLPTSSTGQDYAADGTLASALPALLEGDAPVGLAAAPTEDRAAGDTADDAAEPESADEVAPTASEALGAADPLARLRDPAELASCLVALLPPEDDSVEPLALDYAAYGGQPALVVVLPATGAADKVDVFVVGAGCRQGDDRTLFFTRLDRP